MMAVSRRRKKYRVKSLNGKKVDGGKEEDAEGIFSMVK